MDDPPPGSRLAVVRSQIAIDSDSRSDESRSTTSTNDTANTDTEPFPEYDESECEMLGSSLAAEKPLEEAWISALGRATQQEIRMLHVDPNIVPYCKSEPSQRSQVVLGKLQDLLSEPQLGPEIREQFIAIINATLKVNLVIFHQSPEFLGLREMKDARRPLDTIIKHVQFIEDMLKWQLQTAEKVSYVLEDVSMEPILPYERLRKMATMVAHAHVSGLPSASALMLNEQEYEEAPLPRTTTTCFVHGYVRGMGPYSFPSFAQASTPGRAVPKLPTHKVFSSCPCCLGAIHRCIEIYGTLTRVTLEIKRQYFAPTMGYLCDSPEIWKQCWKQYQEFEKDQHESAEQGFSECALN
ncbi:hypothetical protein N7447_010321 [Penicillium robsamsonii]|uniref:uncharacterized protein n=1 Tax=Penicillium robsamsonii TaxID=1792511 RepID=UPI002549BC9C|nr:uncharacterized protein N7447_010321 [Penicillium robsamsonii]KAJ5810805.1 hypothetical protein N7447_010321 [Penicillium robsamsonii]